MFESIIEIVAELADFFLDLGINKFADRASKKKKTYDKGNYKPVLKCSICNGEQVAGFKDIHTGKFEEVMLIRSQKDLEDFMHQYGISEVAKEY